MCPVLGLFVLADFDKDLVRANLECGPSHVLIHFHAVMVFFAKKNLLPIEEHLDCIVTAGPQPVRAVMATGTKTPIVFAILNDPIGDGFIANLAQPGGNITGLSMAGTDLESKRLEVLKDAAPAVAKVMVLHDPSMGSAGLAAVEEIGRASCRERV